MSSPVKVWLMRGMVHAISPNGNLQDRDGAVLVLDRHTRQLFPFSTSATPISWIGSRPLRAHCSPRTV
jgi:hypothetical protein